MQGIDIFPWNENFATGLDIVDAQHHKLVTIINELTAQYSFQPDTVDINTIFEKLVAYTHYHFQTEESIWKQYLHKHPSEIDHQRSHAHFIETLRGLIDQQQEKPLGEVVENTLHFLVQWLVSHILESDRYMAYQVKAIEDGHSIEEAKEIADMQMNEQNQKVVKIIINIYDALLHITLRLMQQLDHSLQTEQKLMESIERFQKVAESMSDLIYEWEVTTDTLKWFGDIDTLLGFEPWEISQDIDAWMALIHPDDAKVMADAVEVHRNKTEPIDYTYRIRQKDGTYRIWQDHGLPYLDDQNKPYRWVGICTDITEKIETEEQVKKIEARHKATLNNTPDGYMVTSTKAIILEVNDAYCRMSGYSREELIGQPVSLVEVQDNPEEVAKRVERVLRDKKIRFESLYKKKTGEAWPTDISVTYSVIEGGLLMALIRDMSERQEYEERLLAIQNDLKETQAMAHIGSWIYDIKTDLFEGSDESKRIYGVLGQEPLNFALISSMVHPDDLEAFTQIFHSARESGYYFDTHRIIIDNEIRWMLAKATVEKDQKDKAVRYHGILQDITQLKNFEEQVNRLSYYDTLTELPNRMLFTSRIEMAMAQMRRYKQLLAICYLDLDDFKDINDIYGVAIGDRLLQEVAQRLLSSLRPEDTLSRFGGDEFIFGITSIESTHQLEEKLQEILALLHTPYQIDTHRIHISGCIGVTIYPTDDSNLDTLVRHADHAMLEAKKAGKSQYAFFNPTETQQQLQNQALFNAFTHALKHKEELFLCFQPKVDLRNGKVIGFEALIRWMHPERGLLSPAVFLPVIENTSKEVELGEYVISQALKQLYSWRQQGETFTLSINISPRHLQMQSLFEYLKRELQHYDISLAEWLEVLEVASIGDTKATVEIMNQCTDLGIHFSLDDFGTGYSSLTHFHRLPINTLKIDQNFVRNMFENANDMDIVEGVISLANTLKRPVVAEGVETEEIGLLLLMMGCRYAQGYTIAKPMPIENVQEWLQVWRETNLWHQLKADTTDAEEHYDINAVILNHQRWIEKLKRNLSSKESSNNVPFSKTEYQFSRWYHGVGKVRYGSHKRYSDLDEVHQRVHTISQEVYELHVKGHNHSTEPMLDQLNDANHRLITLLKQLTQ